MRRVSFGDGGRQLGPQAYREGDSRQKGREGSMGVGVGICSRSCPLLGSLLLTEGMGSRARAGSLVLPSTESPTRTSGDT